MYSINDYNALVKACDDIYRAAARRYDLSESMLWLLYLCRVSEEPLTQAEAVAQLYLPKQTVNSALKKLELQGMVRLEKEGQLRKRIHLTPAGEALCTRTADHIIAAERTAFSSLSGEEQAQLLKLTAHFNEALNRALEEEDHAQCSE